MSKERPFRIVLLTALHHPLRLYVSSLGEGSVSSNGDGESVSRESLVRICQ
jgi:hypothetical protein